MISVDPKAPRGIVWIASYPRSGTTWVRVFLHHLIRMQAGRPLEDHDINHLGKTSGADAARLDVFERFLGKRVSEADVFEVLRVRPQVQAAIMEEARGVLPVKTHSLLGPLNGTPLINRAVSAGGIYIVRNPLDVVISLSFYLHVTIDHAISHLAASHNMSANPEAFAPEVWGSWTENVESWTMAPSPVIRVVRYEDMLADPVETFRGIAEHMRLGATPEEIDEAIGLASFARLRAQEDEVGFREKPLNVEHFFRDGRAGQWRDVLDEAQVEAIVAQHGDQMRRFGYLPSH